MASSFFWWWQDQEEMALWKKLNSLSPEERNSPRYKEVCQAMVRRYGNIYFFKPYPAQLAPHCDSNDIIFLHGNNSAGKSFCAASYTAYEVVGWSPYREVKPAKYGKKIIWAFSPTFDIQRSSSQVHLFSTDSPNDIGLLPRFEVIEEHGGKVRWAKRGILDYVEFPVGNTILEFKSAEQQMLALSASGIDFVWLDECPPASVYDEAWARVIRKDGRMIMSFLVDDASSNYVVQDIYQKYLQEKAETGRSNKSFYFFKIEDNLSLKPEEIEKKKSQFTTEARLWRFSEGGGFYTEPKGMRVYGNFSSIHVKDDLTEKYDPTRTLWRFWDLGLERPACIGVQVDAKNRLKYLFAILGHRRQLTDFIDDVEQETYSLMPSIMNKVDVLPHDARRRYDVSTLSAEDVFRSKKPKLNVEVLYTHSEPAIALANDRLRLLRDGEPIIQIDSKNCSLLIQCLSIYSRDVKTGKPKEDKYYEHISDCFKMSIQYLARYFPDERAGLVEELPRYYRITGDGGYETKEPTRKRHTRLFSLYMD